MTRIIPVFLGAFCFYFGTFSAPAFAYLDPASGSAFMSAIIGIFVAVGVFVKTYWYKLKSIFGFGRAKSPAVERSQREASEVGSEQKD